MSQGLTDTIRWAPGPIYPAAGGWLGACGTEAARLAGIPGWDTWVGLPVWPWRVNGIPTRLAGGSMGGAAIAGGFRGVWRRRGTAPFS